MAWDPTPIADITGPAGADGAKGDPGADGTDGNSVLNGSGAPAGTLGVDGDFYIDTAAHAIYGPKASGAWGSATSLVGPQGENAPDAITSVTAADTTIAIGGTATAVTVAVDAIAQTQVTGLGTALAAKADQTDVDTALAGKVDTDDPALTDARTPLAHAASHHTGGSDPLAASDIGAAATSHTHAESDITGLTGDLDAKADDSTVVHLTGAETVAGIKTFSSAPVVPVGAAAGNPVRRDDARLTDARTPLDHNTSHFAGGSDEITPSDIEAADAVHTHSAADITSGTLAADRLPLVTTPPVTLAYAATLAVDATDGDYQRCALTGGVTAWNLQNGADGQKLLVRLTAAASQTVDLSGLTKLSFIDDSITVDSDSPAYVGFICDGTNSWTCVSAGAVG